jgi:hypothetical protein
MNLIEDICTKITCPPKFKYSLYDLGNFFNIQDQPFLNMEKEQILIRLVIITKKYFVAIFNLLR